MDDGFDLIGAALSASGIDLEAELIDDYPAPRATSFAISASSSSKPYQNITTETSKPDELPDFDDLMGSSKPDGVAPISTALSMPPHIVNANMGTGVQIPMRPHASTVYPGVRGYPNMPLSGAQMTNGLNMGMHVGVNGAMMMSRQPAMTPLIHTQPQMHPHILGPSWNSGVRPGILSSTNAGNLMSPTIMNSAAAMGAHRSLPMMMQPSFPVEEAVGPAAFVQQRVPQHQLMPQNPQSMHHPHLNQLHHPSQPYPPTPAMTNSPSPYTSSLPSPVAASPSPVGMHPSMAKYPTQSAASPFGSLSQELNKHDAVKTKSPKTEAVDDNVVEEEETMTHAETFANYQPAKLKLGQRHPDAVVETSSLSSVQPPRIFYELALPEATIDSGSISALQLEAIVYACQRHDKFLADGRRAGFLIGDGAGVGKGRTIAGIIFENYLLERKKALWVSVSNDLKYDAARDLKDVGAIDIPVYSLNKFRYAKISSKENGSIKKGVVFSTYSSLISESSSRNNKIKSRLNQLVQWFKSDFDGCIIFDECHRAKNLCPTGGSKPTKTGQVVLEIQRLLPKARIVYASATGASEPKNMAYMTRLGLWGPGTPFTDFNQFIQAVERRGVGAMEIVAMDMKLRGMYLARQLSFSGVSFKIEEVPLSAEFEKMYNDSVALWVKAREYFAKAASYLSEEECSSNSGGSTGRGSGGYSCAKMLWGQFWSSHQRFFKYLCIASKVKHVVTIARQGLKNGKCVVIGLQSTGEARTLEQIEAMGGGTAAGANNEGLEDFVSTAKGVFQALVEKYFPSVDNGFGADSGVGDLDYDYLSPTNGTTGGGKAKSKYWAKMGKNARYLGMNGSESKRRNERLSSSGRLVDDDDDEMSDYERQFLENDEFDNSEGERGNNSDDCFDNDGLQSDDGNEDDDDDDEFDQDDDDANPFAAGNSDDEGCPWLKKKSAASGGCKRKKTIADPTGEGKRKKRKREEHEGDSVFSNGTNSTTSSYLSSKRHKNDADSSHFGSYRKSSGSSSGVNGMRMSGSGAVTSPGEAAKMCTAMRNELLAMLDRLDSSLPANTLDQLIDELGGTENVAEMTGRKGRVVSNDAGDIQYEKRSEAMVSLEVINVTEKKRFMDLEKRVAIISEAASSGISLQADRRAKNQLRRIHITMELPWSADRAVQQFGRTHRSNQVHAPEYLLVISSLAGERRFASVVAKRLECLGALTHGDRRATEHQDLSCFNIDNKYGRVALDDVYTSILSGESGKVQPPKGFKTEEFFKEMKKCLVDVGLCEKSMGGQLILDKDASSISKFLNRILGMRVRHQNALFDYFTNTLDAIIMEEKKMGKFDLGILDLGKNGESITKRKIETFRSEYQDSTFCELYEASVERGVSYEEALKKYSHMRDKESEGFYVDKMVHGMQTKKVVLVSAVKLNNKKLLYTLTRPNVGALAKLETLNNIQEVMNKVEPAQAQSLWEKLHSLSEAVCSHQMYHGSCRRVNCDVGKRLRKLYVLSGSVLSVWNRVENMLAQVTNSKMQVIRLKTTDGQKVVGLLIPPNAIQKLKEALSTN